MDKEELEKETVEWFHKEYEPADLQLNQYAKRNEDLRIPARVYLKDLKQAYLAGAEPREKRIAELEEDLKHKKIAIQNRNKRIKELEKENAELKEELKNQKADYETYYKSCYNAQKKAEGQLTKAKEIIKEYINLDYVQLSPSDKVIDLRDRAEQFLKKVK